MAYRLLLLALIINHLLLGHYKLLKEFNILLKCGYITIVLFKYKYTLLLLNFKALLKGLTSLYLGLILNLRLKELNLYLIKLSIEVIKLYIHEVEA